ncbi:uncharacterized protein HD556DRAFT_1450301 [Suillus plorans]|uniref:Heterokaryon incompatibility domain-containing protein n=1 Tax=Suillus plorans TaxID=116603 RepID=A0A9P7ACW4_9AGAM|nr:uncharacterized protein HD556DRAFT_1450301 [Suillus plorans]KAG1785862.1 hypothetical protein HD556DRAFT_1450301 [Suillus plorans]
MSELITITTPLRLFEGHEERISAVAVFPDKRRMITGSYDTTLRLWDLKTGVVLKKMEGHRNRVWSLAVSRDGQLIASGDSGGEVIVWHGETGESLTKIEAYSNYIDSLDFSPDGTVLATGAFREKMTKLWNTKTWQLQGETIECDCVRCVRYSPSGELLAIATYEDIQIYNSGTRKRVKSFKAHKSSNLSLAWTPDGTRLLTGGNNSDPTIREWDTKTWKQVGDPWTGHTDFIHAIAIHPAGTLVSSASRDNDVRLWQLSDRRTVAIFKRSSYPVCDTFSVDGNHIFSGGDDKMISEWTTIVTTTVRDACIDGDLSTAEELLVQDINTDANNHTPYILAITTSRIACLNGDLSTAEELLTQDINTSPHNYTSYAHRSFVMARKYDWDRALLDAITSIRIQPSLTGYISKGIALCGQGRVLDARAAFDVASMYTDQDSEILHFLLLIKVITFFNADQHDEANLLLKELATGCPNADTLACGIVQAYLYVQLGIKALDGARYDEAADHFTAALDSRDPSSKSNIHEIYEDLVVLFGWDLKSTWQKAHHKRCDALLRAGKLQDAVKSYQHVMTSTDEITNADCLDWSNGESRIHFKQQCSALCAANGDAAFAASDYDKAIDLYSVAIDLDSASDIFFASRSEAKLSKMLWEDALFDARKVTELNPSSHVGYQLSHSALRGAQRYDEAIEAFTIMLSKLDDAPEEQIRDLRQQYVCPSEAEDAIRGAVWIELSNAPLRLLNTSTGILCDRAAQLNSFKTSPEYKELLSSITKRSDLQMERIKEVVATHFRCVLLSHRWEETEVLLHHIQNTDVRELKGLGGITKLQSFCKIARDAGYFWAWMDTCCIDKSNNAELGESVQSMFVWYRHSALTIVYLSDVPPSSEPGALASSVWNERGWTFQEFVAPKVIRFYQKDWSLYLNDRSLNHKESQAIMKELEGATGIDAQALISFRPGMRDARQKLQWASKRVTTVQEDTAYSLFGIFDVHLPVIYGERKQSALGRLLQDIVSRSGDITSLDWVGQSSEFNSCLPADLISYATPPYSLPSLSEDEIQTAVSSLRNIVPVDSTSQLYDLLENMNTPLFANCRLRLPCIAFRVTEVKRRPGRAVHSTYEVKADGLQDLMITTGKTLIQFSRARPIRQTFFLVRPWDRRLLGLPDFSEQPTFADEGESVGDWSESQSGLDDTEESSSNSPGEEELSVDLDVHSQSLRLMVHLGQAFSALLLAQQHVGEYKRVASDQYIIAQVKDPASIDITNIRTLDIL